MLKRREVLFGGLLTLMFTHHSHADGNLAPHTKGCCLKAEDVDEVLRSAGRGQGYLRGEEPLSSTSGNRPFDIALGKTLAMLSEMFEVTPGFAFYEDEARPNAYATSENRLGRPDGTVAFGTTLLAEFLASNHKNPEVLVAGVCAHEFAHILQFKSGLYHSVLRGQKTVKRLELQADFLAGYFAGKRKLERPSFAAANIALGVYRLGDNNFESENHHGTPEERGNAVAEGFRSAHFSRHTLNEAIEFSTRYVATL